MAPYISAASVAAKTTTAEVVGPARPAPGLVRLEWARASTYSETLPTPRVALSILGDTHRRQGPSTGERLDAMSSRRWVNQGTHGPFPAVDEDLHRAVVDDDGEFHVPSRGGLAALHAAP